MPHSKNAKKRHRQSVERGEKNRSVKRELKTRVRKVVESVKAGKLDEAQVAMQVATQKLDHAAAKDHPPQRRRTVRKAALSKTLLVAKRRRRSQNSIFAASNTGPSTQIRR